MDVFAFLNGDPVFNEEIKSFRCTLLFQPPSILISNRASMATNNLLKLRKIRTPSHHESLVQSMEVHDTREVPKKRIIESDRTPNSRFCMPLASPLLLGLWTYTYLLYHTGTQACHLILGYIHLGIEDINCEK